MDLLVMGDFLLWKDKQPVFEDKRAVAKGGKKKRKRNGNSKVKKFFIKKVLPLARKLSREGKTLLPCGIDPIVKTYYIDEKKKAKIFTDLDLSRQVPSDNLEEMLIDMWTRQGFDEFCVLTSGVSELSKALYFVEREERETPMFIYAMF
jgi:hypothetical protein